MQHWLFLARTLKKGLYMCGGSNGKLGLLKAKVGKTKDTYVAELVVAVVMNFIY